MLPVTAVFVSDIVPPTLLATPPPRGVDAPETVLPVTALSFRVAVPKLTMPPPWAPWPEVVLPVTVLPLTVSAVLQDHRAQGHRTAAASVVDGAAEEGAVPRHRAAGHGQRAAVLDAAPIADGVVAGESAVAEGKRAASVVENAPATGEAGFAVPDRDSRDRYSGTLVDLQDAEGRRARVDDRLPGALALDPERLGR
jgi:hypothetical protein